MCMCMYACVSVCSMCMCMYACVSVCSMCMCMYACVCMYYISMCMRICMCMCISVSYLIVGNPHIPMAKTIDKKTSNSFMDKGFLRQS